MLDGRAQWYLCPVCMVWHVLDGKDFQRWQKETDDPWGCPLNIKKGVKDE